MTGINSAVAALREVWSTLHLHGRELAERAADRVRPHHEYYRPQFAAQRSPWPRRCLIGSGAIALAAIVSCGVIWWQLASGSIAIDFATPWLTSAIEERFGGQHRIEVGGTVLERDEIGRSALRLRDIVVRDAQGTVIASAPKAEVGISSFSLLTGRVQTERLSLIGAEMAVRIEAGGQINLLAGAGKPALAVSPSITSSIASAAIAAPNGGEPSRLPPVEVTANPLSAILAWIDRLDSLGLDGGALSELGLKDCTLVVEDQRNGKRWSFGHINLSLTRPMEGGVAFAVNSTGADGLWSLTATVTPKPDGRRTIETVIRDVSPKDLMLALRAGDGQFSADVPLSAVLRAEIERDGTLQLLEGRILAGAGEFGSRDDADSRIHIDEAQLNLRWNAATRQLQMPVDAQSGPSRVNFMAQLDVPEAAGAPWTLSIPRGLIVLASADRTRDPPLIIDRVAVRAHIDPVKRLFEIDQADLGGMAGGFAVSGAIDFSTPDPRLALGVAGTRMTVSAFKRLWPAMVTPRIRSWVVERIAGGTVERVVIATNAPLSTMEPGGPPLPDDGLSIELVTSGSTLRVVDNIPALRDADLTTRVQGRTATVRVGRAIMDLPSGRKLTLTNGVFEVPDTHPKPSPARTRFRAEGSADAAAELLAMERLRDSSNVALDPATTKGNFVAQVALDHTLTGTLTKDNLNYAIDADITNFAAEKWVRGQKVEAASLKLTANSQGFYTKGDVKIGGLPATVEYRKSASDVDAEVRIQATLDDAGRTRLGFGMGEALSGPVPLKVQGRVAANERESRYQVEADLKDSKITELLPGWWKTAGKATRVTFTVIDKPQVMRFDDIVIDGPGTLVKGMIELDANGEIALASFPSFALSDGDKATLRADRVADGTLKVTMRGELFDGRGFIKSATSGPSGEKSKQAARDFDLDVKLATVTGYNVEALRGVELRMSRRNGHVRTFGMLAKLGTNSSLTGDLRAYPGGRQVVYFEANDAGALLRFTDTYSRVVGGQMWMAMDPPTADQLPQEGVLNVRDFSIRGESTLEKVAANGNDPNGRMPQAIGSGVTFSRMRAEFTRSPGKMMIRDGVVWGPAIGATLEGQFDYARDDVRLRGTFIPAYALNNFLARVPIVGMIIGGGQNEGVFGMTYEVVGPQGNATLRVAPMSMLAPGFLRKIFEFRGAESDKNAVPPYSSPTR
ncbi:MAG: hypothetical protein QOF14_339 [Hyphomicrobiales bacterium]|jgi:hypothetical protein|nr:hypothetical protein [Hyphomicrobiales bacterium]